MKRCEHGEIRRPVFEGVIEVPDFEMVAHADEQGPLGDATPLAHPRRDRDAAPAIEPGRRHEPEGAAARRLVRANIVLALPFAVAAVAGSDAGAVVHDHAPGLVVKPDEEMVVRCPRLDRDAERIVQRHVAARTNARQRTADEEIIHVFSVHRIKGCKPKARTSTRYSNTIAGGFGWRRPLSLLGQVTGDPRESKKIMYYT
jgi:hypothetical protein